MKKRIHGLMYNTETAKLIAEVDNGFPVNDFKHAEYKLFKKRTGEYFLYGKGGGLSDCAQYNPAMGGYQGGEIIKPYTIDETKAWLEEWQDDFDHDIYDQEFGKIKRSGEKVSKLFSITTSAAEKLERMASVQGKTQSEIVENLIDNN